MTKDGPTILLVDDHEELRRVLARILMQEGYEVLLAEDGRAALAITRAGTSSS